MNYNIYIISFQLLWETLYPPILRLPKHLAWGKVLERPLQYLHQLFFTDYANGSAYPYWNPPTTYNIGDRVISAVDHTNRSVYECIATTIFNDPTDTNYWVLVNDNYIGIRERIKYNSQKVLFEFALNKWFMCSGIRISNQNTISSSFLLGQTGPFSSTLSNSSIIPYSSPSYLTNNLVVASSFNYIIFVPNGILSQLALTVTDQKNIVRSFADNYNLAGMIYDVQGY